MRTSRKSRNRKHESKIKTLILTFRLLQCIHVNTMSKKLFFLILASCIICFVRSHRFDRRQSPVKRGPGKFNDCLFNICEHMPNYPEKNIQAIIQKSPDIHSYFGNVIEPSNPMPVSDRFGGADYEPFCKTVDLTVLPKFMRDVNNEERAIANVAGYQQVVKFQTCDFSSGEQCYAGSLLEKKTRCMQRFHVIKLLTANMKNNSLEYRDFQIPTTCVCTYLSDD